MVPKNLAFWENLEIPKLLPTPQIYGGGGRWWGKSHSFLQGFDTLIIRTVPFSFWSTQPKITRRQYILILREGEGACTKKKKIFFKSATNGFFGLFLQKPFLQKNSILTLQNHSYIHLWSDLNLQFFFFK